MQMPAPRLDCVPSCAVMAFAYTTVLMPSQALDALARDCLAHREKRSPLQLQQALRRVEDAQHYLRDLQSSIELAEGQVDLGVASRRRMLRTRKRAASAGGSCGMVELFKRLGF